MNYIQNGQLFLHLFYKSVTNPFSWQGKNQNIYPDNYYACQIILRKNTSVNTVFYTYKYVISNSFWRGSFSVSTFSLKNNKNRNVKLLKLTIMKRHRNRSRTHELPELMKRVTLFVTIFSVMGLISYFLLSLVIDFEDVFF